MPEILIDQIAARHTDILPPLHRSSFGAAAWNTVQIAGGLALDTTQGWVAHSDGQPAGFILCQINPPHSEILTLCVDPAFRRHGIAEQLLNAAIPAVRGKACDRLFLEVASDNRAALALYAKHGFQITGKRPRYYPRGDQAVDAILLTLIISLA